MKKSRWLRRWWRKINGLHPRTPEERADDLWERFGYKRPFGTKPESEKARPGGRSR